MKAPVGLSSDRTVLREQDGGGLAPDKFTYNSVWKLLSNRRYIGENHFKDIVMPDSIRPSWTRTCLKKCS